MDIQKLKSVYDAARALNGHNLDEAALEIGKSTSMINQVLAGSATSKPVVDAILTYSRKAGLQHTISKLGLDPDMKLKKQTA